MSDTSTPSAEQKRQEEFNCNIGTMFDEAGDGDGKLLQLTTFTLEQFRDLAWGVLNRDPNAGRYVRVIAQFVEAITQRRGRDRFLCMTCNHRLDGRRMPDVIAVLHAMRSEPSVLTVYGLCRRCVARLPDQQAIFNAILDVVRRKLLPDARLLPPIWSQAGSC